MSKFVTVSIMFIVIMVVAATGVWVGVAHAESPHQTIRPSLVYLKATALGASGVQTGVKMESTATGFLVSEDGLILTVYHLLTKMGNFVPDTLMIKASIKEKNANAWSAAIVDASINTDLLLLKIPPGTEEYPKVALGSALSQNDSDAIFTSGFPNTLTYITREDKIEAREGPGGYLWTTGLKFEQGQSGSPVYNADAEVIGIVKGDEGSLGYMIPIEFADPLLVQVRLREIQKELSEIKAQVSKLQNE